MSSRWRYPALIAATLAGACRDKSEDRRAGHDAAAPAAPRTADAAAALDDDPCAPAALRAERKRAQVALTAGRAAEAVTLLAARPCPIEPDQALDRNAEAAWAISDLAFARYKAGDARGCYVAAESQLLPHAGNVAQVFDDSDRVIGALQHNSALCREAIEQGWGSFANAECTFDPESHGIPPEVLGPDQPSSCLEIAAGSRGADAPWTCGAVTLIARRGASKPTRLALRVPDSQLTDGSVCCNVTQVGFARAGDAVRLRVDGEGRDCGGGTASSTETTIYELRGDTLTVIDALQAAYH